jgi:hypothetical protein
MVKAMEKRITTRKRFPSLLLTGLMALLWLVPSTVRGTSCTDLIGCEDCSSTYTCHWCDHDGACHARGSVYGCAWGGTCRSRPDDRPKENSTCASHDKCSDCALSSHFCHWCEQDNACHSVGSPYGCAIGVDCYSNERCRRKGSEPQPGGLVPDDIPTAGFVVLLTVALLMVGCLSCCHYCATNVKGAYDDLATITMAASVAPMSVIGGHAGHFFTTLEPNATEQEGHDDDHVDPQQRHSGKDHLNGDPASRKPEDVERQHHSLDALQDPPGSVPDDPDDPHHNSPFYLMNEEANTPNPSRQENRPLLHPTFNDGSIVGIDEPPHMKKLYRACSIVYYISVALVLVLVGTAIVLYPQRPVYNVCNDAVAWKKIMSNLIAFKLGASFEILLSLNNPNRIVAALEKGKGSFKYDGRDFGTYEIPPVTADAMAITDLMLIARVTPDKTQALQIAEAYYLGKLILEAEFEGTIRIPALFDFTFDIHVKDIVVNVNELSDRSLCHCPTWDGHGKNHSGFLTAAL